jgi:hypothetical protein
MPTSSPISKPVKAEKGKKPRPAIKGVRQKPHKVLEKPNKIASLSAEIVQQYGKGLLIIAD